MLLRLAAVVIFTFVVVLRLPAPVVEEQPTPAAAPKSKVRSTAPAVSKPRAKTTSMAESSVRVVLSPTTEATLKYLREYVQHYESQPFIKCDVKPDEILPRLQQALSSHFKSVSITNSGFEANAQGDLVMIFDLQAKAGSFSGTHNTVTVSGTFKDSSGKVLQTLSGSGKSTVPYPAFHTSFPKALDAAFADFSQKLMSIH